MCEAARAQEGRGAGELGRRLLQAARAGDTALVLELMAAGAAFTADWLGTSPLHAAAAGAHADTCAVLLRAGVSRDCRTKVERTALHEAAAAGHARVAALLLAHGAQADAADMLRMTPLHWAAERGHAQVVRVLLRHGADPARASKFLLTPRDLAARRRHLDVVSLLDDAARERDEEARRPHPAPPPAEERAATSPHEAPPRKTSRPTFPAQQPTDPIKIKVEKPEAGGAALLRAHGITLLPPDAGGTVLSALQSGRSVVLSDAGKLMLKESVSSASKILPPVSSPARAAARGGVVLTATPVREPPRGVKVFTLNNKTVALPREHRPPADGQDVQIKLVQVGGEARRAAPLKAKRGAAVKIIMHKANFDKMVASNTSAQDVTYISPTESDNISLATAQRTISSLTAELRAAREELQQTRHELHATREELQQTRHELHATREELQRTRDRLRQCRPDDG